MARSFNGTTDGISCGNSATLNPTTITVAAWVYSTNWNVRSAWIVARDDNTLGRAYSFGVNTGVAGYGIPILQINGTALSVGSTHINESVWNHIAFTGNAASGYIYYVNGSATTAATGVGTTINSTTGATTIGYRTYTGSNGRNAETIADAAMWNVILTPAEIAALAAGRRPRSIRTSVAWLPLDGIASPEPDFSGNALNGTLTGTASAAGPAVAMFTPKPPIVTPLAAPTGAQIYAFNQTGARFSRNITTIGY